MKKRFITLGIILSLVCTFLTACTSKKDDTADDPYKNFKQAESSYGIKYKIPKSWIAVDTNSDDASLYYKNELGNNDGLLSVVYHKFNGNVLDSKNIEKVKNSIKKSKNYKDDLKGEYVQVNSIDVEKLYYNESIDGNTYKNEMLIFPVKNGYFVVCAMSFPENDYSSDFDKIFESIEITSAYDATEGTTEKPTTAEVTTEATTKKTTQVNPKSKDITDKDIDFSSDYRNDSTGKWRIAVTSDSFDIEKYALSYYLNYFKADDEIHVIVNFTRMTTTKISDMGDTLDVSIHEYTKGEEHNANKALGGMLLNEYHVNIKTGKITKIQ